MNTPEQVNAKESGLPINHDLPLELPSEAASLIGKSVGPYRIVRKLGKGGMGAVYEALHTSIGQRAAIKVLHPHLSQDPKSVRRFVDEARLVSMVGHAGLVKVYDFSQEPGGGQCIVMEYLDGESLWSRFLSSKGRGGLPGLPLNDVLHIGRQVAGTLAAVHARGIIHRDLKPDNIMIVKDPDTTSGERAKILDFGIAKLDDASSGSRHTTAGVALGTPTYMAPEQIEGRSASDRIDVYALGVILFELLAGRPPFVADTTGGILRQHLVKEPPPLPGHVPAALRDLIGAALAKEPAERPTMQAVGELLDGMVQGKRRSSAAILAPRRVTPMTVTEAKALRLQRLLIAVAVFLLLLVAGVCFVLLRPRSAPVLPQPSPSLSSRPNPGSSAPPKPQTKPATKPEIQSSPSAPAGTGQTASDPAPSRPGPAAPIRTKKPKGESKPAAPPAVRRFGDLPKSAPR